MAATIERTPSPSPTGKFGKFRRGRKGKDPNVSTQSLASTASTDDGEGVTVTRVSTDSIVDKLLPGSRRGSEDTNSTTEPSKRLSKLLPSKMKRRKGSTTTDEEERRGSLLSIDNASGRLSRQTSSTSLNKSGSVHSSLMTEDSEQDSSPHPARPSISPHHSHAGYLTINSPSVNAQTNIQVIPPPEDEPLNNYESAPTQPPVSKPQAKESSPKPPLERRHSPVDRFKTAFSLGKKKPSLDADSLKSAGTGGSTISEGRRDPDASAAKDQSVKPKSADTPSKGASSNTSSAPSTKPSSIDTANRPATPPNPAAETPETLVTPPTPTQGSPQKQSSPTKPSPAHSNTPRARPKSFHIGSLTSAKSISSLSGPALTPPIEETKTPGGSLTSPTPSAGFFSSVFNAAQTAANQFSNPFQNNPTLKGRPDLIEKSVAKVEKPVEQKEKEEVETPQRPSTSATLGGGNPRLAQISLNDGEPSPMTSTFNVPPEERLSRPTTSDDQFFRTDETSANTAVSAAYEKPLQHAIAQAQGVGRPQSVASQRSLGLEQSPSRASTVTLQQENGDIKRSGSIRSRLSDRKKSRKRGSSVGTSNTLAPTISASTSTLAPTPSIASGAGPRPTGYAVANPKRNKDFHGLFRSVPEDDYLIEDYSAALQRDILLHGRFYVSEGHVCFSSNILGWVTNLVIAFDEIVAIEKKNTAIVFPNALVIQTAHSRNVFASFVMRDSTYDLLLGIWKTSHPNLRILPNGVSLDSNADMDRTEKGDSTGSDGSEDGSDDVYDEDAEEEDDLVSLTEAGGNGSIAGSDSGDAVAVPRKASSLAMGSSPPINGAIGKGIEGSDSAVAGTGANSDFPGSATHDPTDCTDSSTHYDRPLIDTTIPAPLGKIYSLYFGPQSGVFMRKWLVDDQKSRELSYEDDKTGLDDTHRSFTYSYIKPLNAPVGPRQTKCIVTASLQSFDLDRAISVDCSTQTPDVPSGNIFTTKTRYCLMWGSNNTTRIVANCTIEWTGKSWLKGPIEKGANDGQTQYVKDLVAALKAAVSAKAAPKGAVKGKKGRKGAKAAEEVVEAKVEEKKQEEDWGLLEPLRPTLGPLVHFLRPFFTTHIVIAVLFVLLVQSWFFSSARGGSGVGFAGKGASAGRMAAYEALWAREEAELWDWLEDRVGLDSGLLATGERGRGGGKVAVKRLRDERMGAREVDEAIRVTEERLGALKEAVGRRKG